MGLAFGGPVQVGENRNPRLPGELASRLNGCRVSSGQEGCRDVRGS